MLDAAKTRTVTQEDWSLFKASNPVASRILSFIASKWKLKRFPLAGGVIISEISMIREVLEDKGHFTSPAVGSHNLITGHHTTDTHVDFTHSIKPILSKRPYDRADSFLIEEQLLDIKTRLNAGQEVDIVHESSQLVYRALWEYLGFPRHQFSDLAVKTLNSVLELSMNPYSAKNSEIIDARLLFTKELNKSACASSKNSLAQDLTEEGFDEETVFAVTKTLLVEGSEPVITFLPRLVAIFIKSGYLDYVKENPEHLPAGYAEALRVITPTPVVVRSATSDVELNGALIKKNENVILSVVEAGKRDGDFDPFREAPMENMAEVVSYTNGNLVPNLLSVGKSLIAVLAEVEPLEITVQTSSSKNSSGSFKQLGVKKLS
jgi:cytochrome P450